MSKEILKIADVRWLCRYLRGRWKLAITGISGMLMLALLSLPSPYISKEIIDQVIPSKDVHLLQILVASLFGLLLLQFAVSYITNYTFNRLSIGIMTSIKRDLFSRILRFPVSFFAKHQTGYVLARFGEIEGLSLFFSSTVVTVIISIVRFGLCLGILVHLDLQLTLIGLTCLPVLFGLVRLFSKDLRQLTWQFYEQTADLSRVMQDSLSGIEVVKCCTAETREIDKAQTRLEGMRINNQRRAMLMTIYAEGVNFIGAGIGVIILMWSGRNIISSHFTLGSYFAFSAYFAQLIGPTQVIANLRLMLEPAKVALQRVHELLSLDMEDSDEGLRPISSLKGDIELRDIIFAYEPDKPVFMKANLKIRAGEKVMLAGPNGSGKSTLVKLILGFYKPQSGQILLDSRAIETICPSSLRQRIAVIGQNTFVFADTVRNNILYSAPTSTAEELTEALRLSGAADFIARMPLGLETEIGERGVRLSGGERQKISIARAILRESDLIVLDEAGIHLDEKSLGLLGDLLTVRFRDKTCIVISHLPFELGTIDRFFWIEQGDITETKGLREMRTVDVSPHIDNST